MVRAPKAPLQAALSDGELFDILAEVASRSPMPLSNAALNRALPKPYRQKNPQLERLVTDLLREGRLFAVGSGKNRRLSAQRPEIVLGNAVRECLRTGPRAKSELKKDVERAAPGFGAVLEPWLATALARGELFEHVRGQRTKRYALEPEPPPDPRPYLKQPLKLIRAALSKLEPLGVTPRDVLAVLADELAIAIDAADPTAAQPVSKDLARVLEALKNLTNERTLGSLLSVRELRSRVPLPKARFDAAALALAASGAIILHHHDYAASLPEVERDELVRDARGNHYVGVALGRQA